jgi:hypothetical protein
LTISGNGIVGLGNGIVGLGANALGDVIDFADFADMRGKKKWRGGKKRGLLRDDSTTTFAERLGDELGRKAHAKRPLHYWCTLQGGQYVLTISDLVLPMRRVLMDPRQVRRAREVHLREHRRWLLREAAKLHRLLDTEPTLALGAEITSLQVSVLLCTVTFNANLAHNLTRSP